MTIDPDVRSVASSFGVDPALVQAVVAAEGDIVRAVRCSCPTVQTREEALKITARSAAHAMSDWIKSGGEERQGEFIAFWAKRWAPVGAANDPKNLNVNWARNVDRLWTTLMLCVLCVLCVGVGAVRAQIPIDQVQILNSPDVRSWPATATIVAIQFWRGAGIHFDFDKDSVWPDVVPPGWDGPIQYTVWILLKIGDRWYASGIIECWRDRPSTDDGDVTENNKIARDWLYDGRWGPMQGHQPQPGERVGFMLTAGDARGRDVHGVAERSGIVEVVWPERSGVAVPMVWREGQPAPSVTQPPEPSTSPGAPALPAVPLASVDLSSVLQELAALNAKVDQLARDEAAFRNDVRDEWKRITKFAVTYLAPIIGGIVAGRVTK